LAGVDTLRVIRCAGAAVALRLAFALALRLAFGLAFGLTVRPAFELARAAGAFAIASSLATEEVVTIERAWACLSILNTLIA